MSAPLLCIRDLAIAFDLVDGRRIAAISSVSLTIHPRQTLAVVGESGCGKSVTAMSVLRLLPMPPARIESGSIHFAGRELLSLSTRALHAVRGREIAMIFQEPMTSLNPVQTIGDQIVEAITLHQRVGRRQATELAAETLDKVGISDPRRRLRDYPHHFSGGMRQRAMIAMAVACRPRLLLADEPTTALDVTIGAQILSLLSRLQREHGMAMMLISHDLGVVAKHADVVCVMYAGRVIEYARVDDLFARPLHPYTRALMACIPRLAQRRERLATIEAIMSDPAQLARVAGHDRLQPWWIRAGQIAPPYCLREPAPQHWVACVTGGQPADQIELMPDIAYWRQRT